MPRNPKAATMARVVVTQANWVSARRALEATSRERRKAIAAAVAAGNTTESVARAAECSGPRIRQIILDEDQ
jgi:hypothetical protein